MYNKWTVCDWWQIRIRRPLLFDGPERVHLRVLPAAGRMAAAKDDHHAQRVRGVAVRSLALLPLRSLLPGWQHQSCHDDRLDRYRHFFFYLKCWLTSSKRDRPTSKITTSVFMFDDCDSKELLRSASECRPTCRAASSSITIWNSTTTTRTLLKRSASNDSSCRSILLLNLLSFFVWLHSGFNRDDSLRFHFGIQLN